MTIQPRFEQLGIRRCLPCGALVTLLLSSAGCNSMAKILSDMLGPANDPTVTAPANMSVECDGAGNQAELTAWLASASFTDDCSGAALTNDFTAFVPECGEAGSVTVTWTVTDDCNNSASASATFTIVDTTDPVPLAPAPISVTCGEQGSAAALTTWLASATATDACGSAMTTTQRSAAPGSCTATITFTATDECGNAASASSTYTTTGDTTDPTMTLIGAAELTVECGSEFEDPGVNIADNCDVLIQPVVTGAVDTHTPGVYVLTYAAIDACGNDGPTLTRTINVVDTTPPVITLLPPKELWPPNHNLVTLTLADLATVEDLCEGELDPNEVGTILDIYSDEPDNDNGDGNTSADIVIVGDHTFSVRAERQGGSNGRVYGIHFEVTDSAGNIAEGTAFVHVPHDQSGAEAVDDGAEAGHVVTP